MAEGQAAEQNNMWVIASSKAPRRAFKVPGDRLKVGRAWEEWTEDFEDEIKYFEIPELSDKVGAPRIYVWRTSNENVGTQSTSLTTY